MVSKLWAWWLRQKSLVDFFLMLPLLALSLRSEFGDPRFIEPRFRELAYLGLICALLLPLIWRRRWPRLVFAVIALVAFGQWWVRINPIAADIGVLVAMYTVVADCSRRWGLAAALVAEFGAVLAVFRFIDGRDDQKQSLVMFTAVIAGVWILGVYIRTRRAYLRSLEERAERLERERDTQVQIAMAAERARIARELHDVVAHNVSVIVVQADGASYAIETDVDRAKRALETISATGRLALAEMRRLLGVLRESDDAGSYAPQPGVEQLTELVEQIRASGLPLDFEVEGVPLPLPPGLQLTIFRIVQESLTNTLKHGGPQVAAQVRLHYGEDAIEVRVSDDGRGAAAGNDGLGHGLVGMRERVAVYGGTVRAGPRAGGGFEVTAWLPVREEARA